jgi:hypothetical protein
MAHQFSAHPIQNMSNIEHLPKSLEQQKPQAWRVKGDPCAIKMTTQPGEFISFDQMESSCPA